MHSKVLGFGLLLAAVAVPSVAHAENDAQLCYAQLGDLDEARSTLEELELAVSVAETDRAKLQVRDNELAAEIPLAQGAERKALVAERDTVREDMASIDELLPAIKTQATALRDDVEHAEHAYIACIEATLD